MWNAEFSSKMSSEGRFFNELLGATSVSCDKSKQESKTNFEKLREVKW